MHLIKIALIALISSTLHAQTYNETSGDRAGSEISTGDYNVIIGDAAGRTLSSQSRNVIMGYRACVGTLDAADGGDGAADEITTADCDPEDSVIIGYRAAVESTDGDKNVIIGSEAGVHNIGEENTFVGYRTGHNNTDGLDNTFIGEEAGLHNTTGNNNTFVGEDAGYSNTTASSNTAIGSRAMHNNEIGRYNTAMGADAGYDLGAGTSDVTGPQNVVRNTVVGQEAGSDIGGGVANTCIGDNACPNTEHSDFNTFIGVQAGFDNNRTDGIGTDIAQRNTGLGTYAGYSNRRGSDNVWIGAFSDSGTYLSGYDHEGEVAHLQTGANRTPGSLNNFANINQEVHRTTVMGSFASASGNNSVAIGYNSRSENTGSIAIGSDAKAIYDNSIAIGYGAEAKAANSVVIGNDDTTLLSGSGDSKMSLGSTAFRFSDVVTNQVSVNAKATESARIELAADAGTDDDDIWYLTTGDGGDFSLSSKATGSEVNVFSITNSGNATLSGDLNLNSDRRLKKNIHNIDGALALLSNLNGKTYFWKDERKGTKKKYGLIAQDVEAQVSELVAENSDGMKTVNYQGLVPILISALNETQQQRAEQERRMLALQEQLDQQAVLIKKLSEPQPQPSKLNSHE